MSSSVLSVDRLVVLLVLSACASARAAPPVLDDGGRLLQQVDRQRSLIAAQVLAEVDDALREARSRMAGDSAAVKQDLKLMIQRLVQAPELSAELRAKLRGRLEAAVREAQSRVDAGQVVDEQAERAAALDRQRIASALARDQEKLKQLMDRFDSLLDEGRYTAADRLGTDEINSIAPNAPVAASARLVAHETGAIAFNQALRSRRQKAVVNTLSTVETSLIPLADDEPMVYSAAPLWEELSNRRRQRANVDLKTVGPVEARIRAQLDAPTTFEFIETPLEEVVEYLRDLHGIEIQIDTKALAEAGIGSDAAVTGKIHGVSLRSALRLMLRKLDLTYVVKDEVLLVTTTEVAAAQIVTKVYPVDDLVVPMPTMNPGSGGLAPSGLTDGFGPVGPGANGPGANRPGINLPGIPPNGGGPF